MSPWQIIKLLLRSNKTHKFKVGDKVIYVNVFGVVWLWTISEQTTWQNVDGSIEPAYHHENTQTPWFPTQEKYLSKASKADLKLTNTELQTKYGFTPTEWYGCY